MERKDAIEALATGIFADAVDLTKGALPDPFESRTEPDSTVPNEIVEPPTPVLVSPNDTVGWTAQWKDGIETFTAPDGTAYVRTRNDEEADLIVTFPRTRGMTDMRLVRADQSTTVARAARKKRREERELRKRGYDV